MSDTAQLLPASGAERPAHPPSSDADQRANVLRPAHERDCHHRELQADHAHLGRVVARVAVAADFGVVLSLRGDDLEMRSVSEKKLRLPVLRVLSP